MLNTLSLKEVYDSEDFNLVTELQVPLLENSTDYFRGVGFFTSGWLTIAIRGLTKFIENGGKARFIVSPNLQEDDWYAIQTGEQAKKDNAIYDKIKANISELDTNLDGNSRLLLAWLVADGILEFKFAFPRNIKSQGMYHDKIGIYTDCEGNRVATHGSFNDSIHALSNGESFSVFKSWMIGQDSFVNEHYLRLERLWTNNNKQFKVYDFIEDLKIAFCKPISSNSRPYHFKPCDEKVKFGSIVLHPYQNKAIQEWEKASYCGIFEMATGTGKTITSLAAAYSLFHKLKRLSVIILVPYIHMIEQWQKSCSLFGFTTTNCSGEVKDWEMNAIEAIQNFNSKYTNLLVLLVVHKTASLDKFQFVIKKLKANETMIIGDEVHGLGSGCFSKSLINNTSMRLGLSATPHRWYDDEGTKLIFDYFGQTCFEYPLEKAIGTYLTPYKYTPLLVQLTEEEKEKYIEISTRLTTLYSKRDISSETEEKIKKLLLIRSKIISSALMKEEILVSELVKLQNKVLASNEELSGILIYCAPGQHQQILKRVASLGLRCHEFVSSVSLTKRLELIESFSKGEIQVLVAIKCLDEGVDIPSTKIAFILASTTNPKEFIQRRGRILRLYEGKNLALIYDFVVTPDINQEADQYGESILKREMPRFVEFSSLAINQSEARLQLTSILDKFHRLDLFQKTSWDVYKEFKEKMEEEHNEE